MSYMAKRVFIALLCAIATAGVHRCARAQSLQTLLSPSGAVGLQYGAGSVKLMDRSPLTALMERKITLGANQGVMAAERYGLTVGGNAIEAVASRSLANPSIAVAAVAVGGAAWAGLATGSAISRALGMDDPLNPDRLLPAAAGWIKDAGGPPPDPRDEVQYCWHNDAQNNDSCAADYTTLAAIVIQVRNAAESPVVRNDCDGATQPAGVWSISPGFAPTPGGVVLQRFQPVYQCRGQQGGGIVTAQYVGHPFGQKTVHIEGVCSASIDALNPTWSRPAGGPPMPNGKCPVGRYTEASKKEAEDAMMRNVERRPLIAPDLVAEILRKGQGIEASPREVTGPASVTGQPQATTTTTTGPDGQPVTTTTTNSPTTRYTYGGDTINYNTTNVTVTNNGGNTTTTTTTTTPGTKDPAKQDDPCDTNPDRAGCAKLGDPPTDSPEIVDKTVEWQEDNLGLPSGCPGPRTMHVAFSPRAWVLDYAPACAVAPTVSAGLVLLAFFSASVLVMRGVS